MMGRWMAGAGVTIRFTLEGNHHPQLPLSLSDSSSSSGALSFVVVVRVSQEDMRHLIVS